MNKKITQSTDCLTGERVVALSSTYITVVNGNLCQLVLSTQANQRFCGYLKLEDDSYEIRGVVTGINLLHGFILEPLEHIPIAMLRVHILDDELHLELDMPEDVVQYENKSSLSA